VEEKATTGSGRANRVNLIWVGIGFGAFYWLLESVRDVLAFGKGTLAERLFLPDLASVWMRLMIICLIIFYGFYAQSLRTTIEARSGAKRGAGSRLIITGLICAALYWILEAARDVFIFKKGTLLGQLLSPDVAGLSVRLLAVSVIVLFSIYVQNMINERRLAEETERHNREILEKEVDERTTELKKANEQLRQEVEGRKRLETALWVNRRCFHDIVNATSDGIVIVDSTDHIRFANLAFENLIGRRKGDLSGETFVSPFESGEMGRATIMGADGDTEVDMRVIQTEWQDSPARLVLVRPVPRDFFVD
jgi:PAS domain-containing protein